eukprot:5110848-Alexandrium_andersonii.AAC.1
MLACPFAVRWHCARSRSWPRRPGPRATQGRPPAWAAWAFNSRQTPCPYTSQSPETKQPGKQTVTQAGELYAMSSRGHALLRAMSLGRLSAHARKAHNRKPGILRSLVMDLAVEIGDHPVEITPFAAYW